MSTNSDEYIEKFVRNRTGDIHTSLKMLEEGTISDINISCSSWGGGTALMYQTRYGTVESMESLLAHKPPALPNLKDRYGKTALHWAVYSVYSGDNQAKVRLLLDYGADKTITDKWERTALSWAMTNNLTECIKELESYTPEIRGGPVTDESTIGKVVAAYNEDSNDKKPSQLSKHDARASTGESTIDRLKKSMLSLMRGGPAVSNTAALICNRPPEPPAGKIESSDTLAQPSTATDSLTAVTPKPAASMSTYSDENIEKFVMNRTGDIALSLKMLEERAVSDINIRCSRFSDCTALMYQTVCGTVESMESLLAHKPPALPNLQDSDGYTALHWAVCSGDNQAKVKLLLDYGADNTIRDNDSKTAIDLGRIYGRTESIKVLESYNPKIRGDPAAIDSSTTVADKDEDEDDDYEEEDVHVLRVVAPSSAPAATAAPSDNMQIETPLLLGLSEQLVSSYTSLLNALEEFRDQPTAQSINARIKEAEDDCDAERLFELVAQRDSLKIGKSIHSEDELSSKLTKLLNDVKGHFKGLDKQNADGKNVARRCSATVKYLKELQACISDAFKLTVVLQKRLAPQHQDNLVFPDKVKRLDWKNINVDITSGGSNIKDSILGSGTFSEVFKAQFLARKGDMRDAAIKILKQPDDNAYDQLCNEALKEADIIANATDRMDNKSGIVTLYGVVVGALTAELAKFLNVRDGQKRVGLVLGYEPTTLFKFLYPASGSNLKLLVTIEQKISLVKNLIDALRNLHSANCVHGDLKPQNILLSGDVNNFLVKLTDFNISELREAQELTLSKVSSLHQTGKSIRGTKAYCAVEQLPDPNKQGITDLAKASRRTDIFSLGVIIWEIFSGKVPHHELGNNEGALCLKVYKGERPSEPSIDEIREMPLSLRELVKQCWDQDRTMRPTVVECLSRVSQIQNTITSSSFDIFFSHCWYDKAILSHVYAKLASLGFRVWYDQEEMSWKLDESMKNGVSKSKVFLCCFNSTYEKRDNCKFELEECKKRFPDKPVLTLLMEDPWDTKGSTWTVKQEFKDMLQLDKRMFCKLHDVVTNMAWGNPKTKDCIPADLLKELDDALQLLIKTLADVKCTPSFAGVSGGAKVGGGGGGGGRGGAP